MIRVAAARAVEPKAASGRPEMRGPTSLAARSRWAGRFLWAEAPDAAVRARAGAHFQRAVRRAAGFPASGWEELVPAARTIPSQERVAPVRSTRTPNAGAS